MHCYVKGKSDALGNHDNERILDCGRTDDTIHMQ